jgi:hypothetical protein
MTTQDVCHGEPRATVEPTALESARPTPAPRTAFPLEVSFPGAPRRRYATLAELRADVDRGEIRRHLRARPCAAGDEQDCGGEAEEAAAGWQTIGEIAQGHHEIAKLFRPLGSAISTGAGYGLLAGVALKAIDTSVVLFAADERAGVLWLLTLLAMGLSTRFGFWPILIAVVVSAQAGLRANFFVVALSAGAVGAAFGIPAGVAIATAVGHFRARKRARIVDAEDEGMRPYLVGLVLPLLFLAAAVPLWIFWVTPRILEWSASS